MRLSWQNTFAYSCLPLIASHLSERFSVESRWKYFLRFVLKKCAQQPYVAKQHRLRALPSECFEQRATICWAWWLICTWNIQGFFVLCHAVPHPHFQRFIFIDLDKRRPAKWIFYFVGFFSHFLFLWQRLAACEQYLFRFLHHRTLISRLDGTLNAASFKI